MIRAATLALAPLALLAASARPEAQGPGPLVKEIINFNEDGLFYSLFRPAGIAADGLGNVFVTGGYLGGLYRIAPGNIATELIGGSDGNGNDMRDGWAVCTDAANRVYVTGRATNNAFRVDPDGTITLLIDEHGDGLGNELDFPQGIAVDSLGNTYVSGFFSNNVFRIAPDGAITQVLDITGDGSGNSCLRASALGVDGQDNLYVLCGSTDNAFRIAPDGTITEILDASGDGTHPLDSPSGLAVTPDGTAYVTGYNTNNVFRVSPDGSIEQILDATAGGTGIPFENPSSGLHVDTYGNLYVAAVTSENALKVSPQGRVTEILDDSGDGKGAGFEESYGITSDPKGAVYVTGRTTFNVLRVRVSAGGRVRNGSGINPVGFTELTQAVLGTTWRTQVDLGADGDLSVVEVYPSGPAPGLVLPGGELLCSPPARVTQMAAGSHGMTLPYAPKYIGLELCAQASVVQLSSARVQMLNAIELRLGTY